MDPRTIEELVRRAGITRVLEAPEDQPDYLAERSILLFQEIKGDRTYKERLRKLAEQLYRRMLDDEEVQRVAQSEEPVVVNDKERTILPKFTTQGRRDTEKVIAHLLHTLAYVASHPTQKREVGYRRLQYVSVPLNEGPYRKGGSRDHLGFTAVKRAVYGLCLLDGGLLEITPGRYNRETGKGLATRVSPSGPFKDMLVAHGLVFAGHPTPGTKKALGPLLRLKRGEEDIVTLDRPLTETESILPDLNEKLSRQRLSINWPDYRAYEDCWDFNEHRSKAFPGGRRQLYRQFVGEDGRGGRLWGHWVQSMPKTARRYLRINEQPIAEKDYSSMQLRILYGIKEREVPLGDLYAGCGYDRDAMKAVLTRAVGCSSREETVQAIRKYVHEAKVSTDPETLYDALWSTHPGLCPHDDPDDPQAWSRLQYAESEVALRVLRLLLEQGVAAVPIHDSFIVPARHGDALYKAMRSAWEDLYPETEIRIDPDDSEEAEA